MIDSFMNRSIKDSVHKDSVHKDSKSKNSMHKVSNPKKNFNVLKDVASSMLLTPTSKRIRLSSKSRLVRKKIEILDHRITLPVARTTLGLLEGEHPSHDRYGNGDILDIHSWQPGDEARMMNWSASARVGQPMVSARERCMSSNTWIICDASISMNASCASGEFAYEVASNAICLFASLSMKRNDTVQLVMVDGDCVNSMPQSHTVPDCERIIDSAFLRYRRNKQNSDSLIKFIRNIRNKRGLIVLIVDNDSFKASQLEDLQKISLNQALVVVNIETINPCDSSLNARVVDGVTLKQIPAFFMDDIVKKEIASRHAFRKNALDDVLTNMKATLINANSSESMLRNSAHIMSRAFSYTSKTKAI